MSLSPMSHVKFKKCPCRPVDFRGRGSYIQGKYKNTSIAILETCPLIRSVHNVYIPKCCDQTVTLNPAVEILVFTSLLYDIGPILFDIGRCVRDAKHGGPRSLSLTHTPLLTTRYTLPMNLVEYRGLGLTTISRVTR